jgi:hypothetical protein
LAICSGFSRLPLYLEISLMPRVRQVRNSSSISL